MGLAGQLSWEHGLSLSREAREEFNQESGKEGARGKEKKKSASMSHKFTSDTARCASRKRKRRFGGSERMKLVQKERSTEYGKKKSKAVVETVNGDFLRSLVSEGSNNMMGCAGVETAVEALNEASHVTRDSCFVDFGCSAGGICLYMAQRYGCKVYGIDKNSDCVRLAREAAERHGLSHLCTFLEADFARSEFNGASWLHHIGATHVLAYNKVFSLRTCKVLFETLARGPSDLVVCCCALKRGFKVPVNHFEKVGSSTDRAVLIGGKSGYALQVWRRRIGAVDGTSR